MDAVIHCHVARAPCPPSALSSQGTWTWAACVAVPVLAGALSEHATLCCSSCQPGVTAWCLAPVAFLMGLAPVDMALLRADVQQAQTRGPCSVTMVAARGAQWCLPAGPHFTLGDPLLPVCLPRDPSWHQPVTRAATQQSNVSVFCPRAGSRKKGGWHGQH